MDAPPVQYCRTEDGINVAWWSLGEGPPLINLTWGSSLRVYWDVRQMRDWLIALAAERRVIGFDWPGHGLSDSDGPFITTTAAFASVLEAVADDAGVTQFDMFAEGMSAPYALTFAAQEPGRVGRIVVWSGFASGQEHFRNPDYRPYLRMDPEGSGGTTQYAVAVLRWAYGKGNGDFGEAVAEAAHGINPESLYAQTKGLWEIDASPLLADIQAPVLVLHRESCPIAPLDQGRKIAARVPHARLTVLPGDSWAPFLPEPGPALGPISEFLGAGEHPSTTPADSGPFRTLLFTDVVASTPLLVQLKDERMRAIMRDHDAVLQAAVDAHGGRVVKTIRDAFMADFAVPSAAVECAIAMQRGIRQFADSDVPIRLRIGINAGEPIAEDDDLHGASVVIAKRLESAAPTDGILVSDVVKQMVMGKDFAFTDLGEVSLKGFAEPVRAWAVAWESA